MIINFKYEVLLGVYWEILKHLIKEVFKFTLREAIYPNEETGKSFLVPYVYNPIFVELTLDELDNYIVVTEKIAKLY